MKLILTGAEGQVGKEISLLCQKKNIEYIPLNSAIDITKKELLKETLTQIINPSIVVNCAAYTAVDKAEDEPEKAFLVNKNGAENLALICKELNIPLIHLSTDFVFSGSQEAPYSEEDTPNPINIYGKSKYEGEKALQSIWDKHLILRVSWVFGQYGQNFVKTILRLASEKEELNVVCDQKGCPTAAEDIARVILLLANKINSGHGKWGVYHYAGNPATTWYDFAKQIIEIAKEKHFLKIKNLNKVTSAQYPTKAKRPKNSELLVLKIQKDYGIERNDWLPSLKTIVAAISKNTG